MQRRGDRADLPPEFVRAPSALVYGDLPRSIALTGLKLWGLGWRHHYRFSDPWELEDLEELLGLGRSQLYEHLRRLMDIGVLRYAYTAGRFTFVYAAHLALSPENRTGVVVGSEDLESTSSPNGEQQQQGFSLPGGECEGGAPESGKADGESGKPDDRVRWLLGCGMWQDVAEELCALDWCTRQYVEGWVNWWHLDQDGSLGVGFLVEAIRKRRPVPAETVARMREWEDRERELEW